MGNLPPVNQPVRIPISIPTPKGLMDHHFQGQPVLPAVEAMEVLARCVREHYPRFRIDHITSARFEKFLPMDSEADRIDAFAEFLQLETGVLQAALLTRTKAPKAAFTRTKTHVQLNFESSAPAPICPPADITASLEGICTTVGPESIYNELVPFGPSFRNIVEPLLISPDGALARIKSPQQPAHQPTPLLGSGYALDAAFHAACVWAQHYHGMVAFPVAMERRTVLKPVEPDAQCTGRVIPKTGTGEMLAFDLLLVDPIGGVREVIQGLQMRDVSGGRLTPPDWIRSKSTPDPLGPLDMKGRLRAVVQLDAVADFAFQGLTELEEMKYQKMGERRRRSYLAARMALKRLYRKCNSKDQGIPAENIETVHKDSPLPRLHSPDAATPLRCSVSHDRRFAIAMASPDPIGVDVEVISDKALKTAGLFMSEAEQNLVQQARMGDTLAAVRIWSIKEAAAKSTGINLAEAWRRVEVTAVNEAESALCIDGKKTKAVHATWADHLFTLLSPGTDLD